MARRVYSAFVAFMVIADEQKTFFIKFIIYWLNSASVILCRWLTTMLDLSFCQQSNRVVILFETILVFVRFSGCDFHRLCDTVPSVFKKRKFIELILTGVSFFFGL